MMEMIQSEVQCTLATDMGHYRHVVDYRANNTQPKAVQIIQLSDMIHELGAEGVLTKATGKLTYDGHNIMADGIVICPCFQGIVTDFKAIIKAIETGGDIPSKPFELSYKLVNKPRKKKRRQAYEKDCYLYGNSYRNEPYRHSLTGTAPPYGVKPAHHVFWLYRLYDAS